DPLMSLHLAHPSGESATADSRDVGAWSIDPFLHQFAGNDFLYATVDGTFGRTGVKLLRPGLPEPVTVITGDVGAAFWAGSGGAPGYGLSYLPDPAPSVDGGAGDGADGGAGNGLDELFSGFQPQPGRIDLIRLGECSASGCPIRTLAGGVDVGAFAIAADL